jgi:hypothetical protein
MSTKKNRMKRPQAFAELTKDTRHEGTWEVLVPVPDRVKPHKVSQHFSTKKAAEDWIHSAEGIEAVDELLAKSDPKAGR